MIRKFLLASFIMIVAITVSRGNLVADTAIIRSHLKAITKSSSFRTYGDLKQLQKTADYIKTIFSKYTTHVTVQSFNVNGIPFSNVIASFGVENADRIVIGAHYDVCGKQEGADDNASGITGLLELARMLNGQKLKHRIDLVAFSLEEPPFFRTENMGSYVHAKSLADSKTKVYGMISLEMIGYFRDDKNSQTYPPGVPANVYGDKGDYITLVTNLDNGDFETKFCTSFVETKAIKTNRFAGPPSMPGIDFSDHLNYWKFGFNALMITDTSFYRNKNYHTAGDVMQTLDIKRMARVIDGIYRTLLIL